MITDKHFTGVSVLLTGVQALGDRGGFDQVTSTQVTGHEMVEVFHQVLPSCRSHVCSFEQKWKILQACFRCKGFESRLANVSPG